jgi:hypothetical protein
MKAQGHGDVSAMEIGRGTQKIGFRCFLLALFAMASLGVSGCGPPKDQKGNLPDDVVRNFLELVEADNYEAARKLWYGPVMLGSVQRTFEDYCARYKKIRFMSYTISKARKGKGDFWMVRVDFDERGKQKHQFFGLKIVDGEWRMPRGYRW